MGREKKFTCAFRGVRLGFHVYMKGWRLVGGINECRVVCIGKWVENGNVVVCERING
jgi:hypothetical protein